MDLRGLYELLERFQRSNQLPAFLIGVVVALVIAYFILRMFRLRVFNDAGRDREIRGLEKQVYELEAETKGLRKDLLHTEKHADALKTRIFELTGGLKAQLATTSDLRAECERFKERQRTREYEKRKLFEVIKKTRRLATKLNEKLAAIAVSNGRIWEVAAASGVALFRPLNQRRTPILSFVNLKGGVGKTTIAANLAVAMNQLGWRVLVVDLDYQGSISQLLLSRGEIDELIESRRLIHEVFQNKADGLASFRRAIVRVSTVPNSEIFLVAADEELGDLETALSHRWAARITTDDVRYRLRTVLHSAEIADRFDFILLDCPPRLTTACVNALAASDYVMVPVLPNSTSTAAAPRLLLWLKHLRLLACPDLSVMGVIGNKAKYYGDAPVKNQRAELDALAGLCQDVWEEPVRFFQPMRLHDPLSQPLPALDPKLRALISTSLARSTRNCQAMRVADLQNFLRALILPLEASGAKKEIVEDLQRTCNGLQPFAEHQIKDFAGFLARAEEYARTGVIAVQAKTARAPRTPKPKVPAITVEDAKNLVASLYERSIADDVTYEHITAEVQRLDKLNAKDLTLVAKDFGVVPGKTKKASLDAVLDKITRRKTTHARTQF